MSTTYKMTVKVNGINENHCDDVYDAVESVGLVPLDSFVATARCGGGDPLVVTASCFGEGEVSINVNDDESKYVERVSKAIWTANRGFCDITITCLNLDDPPCHVMTSEQYGRLMAEVAV